MQQILGAFLADSLISVLQILAGFAVCVYNTRRGKGSGISDEMREKEVSKMDTALGHWLFHFERPHARCEWASETSQMAHDRFFWGTVAVLVGTFLLISLVSLVMWSVATGAAAGTPSTYPPVSWPFPYMIR